MQTTKKNTQINSQSTIDAVVAAIAKKELRINTLETQKSDSLDFHDVAVWTVKAALEAAYRAGFAAANQKP